MRWLLLFTVAASRAEPGYVNPALCRPCHEAIYDSYSRTGMARTFTVAGAIPGMDFMHVVSARRFTVTQKGNRAYMRRETANGENVVEKRIDFAIGSGDHSRTFAHRTPDGRLLELPVSWYAEGAGTWAMSPGYDRPDHSDFRREVTGACLFCHNGYPSEANGGLASGIDCQRCHGPGADHVARGAAILNPAKLTPQRSMEVCLQCHLESASRTTPDALRRFGRTTFSYRPAEALADYQLYFDFVRSAGDRITVNNSAYGLMRSKCYQGSAGRLTCAACHDPHQPASAAAYVKACRGCHASAHAAGAADCASCHMPKRRTEDAVHVLMTDHTIRRKLLQEDLSAPIRERHDRQTGPVKPLYPATLPVGREGALYLAIAQARSSDDPDAAIASLESAIAAVKPTAFEPYAELADACRKAGKTGRALAAYQQAIKLGSPLPAHRVAAAELLLRTGRTNQAQVLLELAVREYPRDLAVRNTLAVVYVADDRFDDAVALLEDTVGLDTEEPMTWLNLGVSRQALGRKQAAAAAYRESIRLQPDLARAKDYLKKLLQ